MPWSAGKERKCAAGRANVRHGAREWGRGVGQDTLSASARSAFTFARQAFTFTADYRYQTSSSPQSVNETFAADGEWALRGVDAGPPRRLAAFDIGGWRDAGLSGLSPGLALLSDIPPRKWGSQPGRNPLCKKLVNLWARRHRARIALNRSMNRLKRRDTLTGPRLQDLPSNGLHTQPLIGLAHDGRRADDFSDWSRC
ncbi:hypothetical protein [Sodalis glossinidius]|uniref:hypothetical protein n=1 Tax=Sodalis glossinidius TaxID=63612 RepID=UPI0003246749|nr:hypothetical protein [Sodalis glossinidius]